MAERWAGHNKGWKRTAAEGGCALRDRDINASLQQEGEDYATSIDKER